MKEVFTMVMLVWFAVALVIAFVVNGVDDDTGGWLLTRYSHGGPLLRKQLLCLAAIILWPLAAIYVASVLLRLKPGDELMDVEQWLRSPQLALVVA